MEHSKQEKHFDSKKSHVGKAASELVNESKKLANELYDEGLHKAQDAQDNVKAYSDEVVDKVRKNPLTSVLIAAGVGFLLSAILKK